MDQPVSIITGAGSGIGRATAILLAERGHRVTLVGRTALALEETAALIRERVSTATIFPCVTDVCDLDRAALVVARTHAAWGRIDCLVNGAGAAPKAPIESTDEELLESTFYVNAFGPASLIARCWPHFVQQKSGCIINISTMGAFDPFPGFFVYAAAKSALDSFTRSAWSEGREHGIRAFCINPGCVETRMLRQNWDEKIIPPAKALPPEAIATVILDCIEGRRDAEVGTSIPVPSP
ncbi:MAG: SDR family oxidoreductase [Phycisphaerae bacterium]|nr:SDR family oxidoreductase [Phycisphaerae bacterium]